jgi:hypothetical protein
MPPGGNTSGVARCSTAAMKTNWWPLQHDRHERLLNIAQVLNEGAELPTPWTRKLINLAGNPAVNNNPNFALRFQWQFNIAGDSGTRQHSFAEGP